MKFKQLFADYYELDEDGEVMRLLHRVTSPDSEHQVESDQEENNQ